jgi:RNA polymerase sigma-70 factor (ECF subfamily)
MPEPDADERLLVEAAQRDSSKFGDLYERHFERVYAFVARRVEDRAAAEDVTAEVFHKALAGLRSYQWRGAPFGAWLIRIAANAVTDRSRRAAREVVNSDAIPDAGVAPADLALIDERARLFRLVDRLPADQRSVIVQRFVDGRSIREVARALKKTEGAIKQLQFRALHNLRARMEAADA